MKVLTTLLSCALLCVRYGIAAGADDGVKPAKTTEEGVLARIDQLQVQLDELRQELLSLRVQKAEPPAPVVEAAAPAKALPVAQGPTPSAPVVAEAVLAPATIPAAQSPPPSPTKPDPFAFGDFTWLTGNARTKQPAFDSKLFTAEIRFDTEYTA